ncbi:MAG: hypothetical protein ABJ308_09705 [Halieaceae bacterium]
MTQHEYVFVTISIILGLAITRLLNEAAALVRAQDRIKFHWSTALWAACIMVFILQLWWVGWELRNYSDWTIFDFFVLVAGAVFIYGASELALPVEDYDVASDKELDFLNHSQTLGRISALSMLGYFAVGPYVNIRLFDNPALPAVIVAAIGATLMALTALKPNWFKAMVLVFAMYAVGILYLTA